MSKLGITHADDHTLPEWAVPKHEGDERPVETAPGPFDLVAMLPHHLHSLHRDIEDLRNIVGIALDPQVWANTADLSNIAETKAVGGAAWAPAFVGYTSGAAVQLRNIMVGTSAAAIVQLVAVRSPYYSGSGRVVGTVRTVTNTLSMPFAGRILLQPGENLFLVTPGTASVNFDFSADYRQMRSE